mmetsp:Transcript_39796/g.99997  ORF Transcript_39796/g.99997 Transcript_39796/m.99997 type:complete len:200 (-) Transcript_39796:246-845(-)
MTSCIGSGLSFGSTRALFNSRPPRAAPTLPVSNPSVKTFIVPVLWDAILAVRVLAPMSWTCFARVLMTLVSPLSMARCSAVCLLTMSRWQNSGILPTSFSRKNSVLPWYTARHASRSAAVAHVGSRRAGEASPKKGSAANSSTAGRFGSSSSAFFLAGDSGLLVPAFALGEATTLGFSLSAFAAACKASISCLSRRASA